MKNVVKWWKDFLLYFTTLETYREKQQDCDKIYLLLVYKQSWPKTSNSCLKKDILLLDTL